jgi:hypothetical protein
MVIYFMVIRVKFYNTYVLRMKGLVLEIRDYRD